MKETIINNSCSCVNSKVFKFLNTLLFTHEPEFVIMVSFIANNPSESVLFSHGSSKRTQRKCIVFAALVIFGNCKQWNDSFV